MPRGESCTSGDAIVKNVLYPCVSRKTTDESPHEWYPRAMRIYYAAHYRASNVCASYVYQYTLNFGLERLHTISSEPNDIELDVRQVKPSSQLRCIY